VATLVSINKKSDDTIIKDVILALEWDPKLNRNNIGVAVSEGVVTLTGVVPNYRMKLEAETTAKSVYGVRAVASDIEVRVDSRRTDAEVARARRRGARAAHLDPERQDKGRCERWCGNPRRRGPVALSAEACGVGRAKAGSCQVRH
jgi:hypothetical protein